MKVAILNKDNQNKGEVDFPSQFSESYRPDLIKRAVLALQSAARQAYGTNPEAGQRHSSTVSKRRRNYRGCYGFGISRVNRKILSRKGTRMFWVGATSPQTRGGRRSHAPKAEKIFEQKINKKENQKAIRSAMAASIDKVIVAARGHQLPETYPFVLSSDFETLTKTKEVESALEKLGLKAELERSSVKKVRAGVGKLRGRKYRRKKGPLVVVSGKCDLEKAAKNLPGVDVVYVNALNAEVLAPGAQPGRITLYTEKALEIIGKENLFQ
ncbi:50S ribosomal protein L4 [Candidatus Woesearchaeota archaeon]|nr:50S ribosomal protein L4 [Candidatus Woesearchaeota archaeon]